MLAKSLLELKSYNLKYSTYLITLFYLVPLIDVLNGYLVLYGYFSAGGVGSPSQLIRFFLMVLMFFIVKKNRLFFIILFLSTSYLFLIEGLFAIFHNSYYGYLVGIVYGSKIIYLFLLYSSFHIIIKYNFIDVMQLLFHTRNSIFLCAILMLIPFALGIGYNTYGEGTFGFKGFFASGNGLGIFMGTGLLLSIFYWKINRDKFSLLAIIVILVATTIIGSKTALIFSLFSILSILYYLKKNYIKYILICFLLISLIIFSSEIISIFNKIFDVIIFRFGDGSNILSFLLSSRDIFFYDAMNNLNIEGIYLMRLFVGFGAYISFRNPELQYGAIDILESDVMDLFYMYGAIILIIYFCIICYITFKLFIKRNYFLTIVFMLLIGHSIFAGYIIFNAMAGLLFPLIILFHDKIFEKKVDR